MIATELSSCFVLDVHLPLNIKSLMVVVSAHGSDQMGRERLKVLVEDWFGPEASE
jgi:hypothetical protein